jgi:cytochrome P450
MEQAAIQRSAVLSPRRPPGTRMPATLQVLAYARDPLGFLIRHQRRYGDVFSVSFPFYKRLVYVADPALVKQLFAGPPEQMHAGEANATVLEPALGPNSVLTLDEAPHLRQRKLLLPPFHGERIARYGEMMRAVTVGEMESWPVGEAFALRPHTQRIALAVILRAVFGVHDEVRLARFSALIERFAGRLSLVTALPPLRHDFGRRSPWARFLRARAALDEFVYEQIDRRRGEVAGGEAEPDDVLSLLLAARHDDGSPMSDEELRDELVTVLAAGHETTATGLAWAFERLLRNPRVLGTLRESIAGGEVSYLEATVRETLRARPVIVDVARRLTAPLEIGGYELAGGTYLMAAIAALHYREDLFPAPQEFRPERFLDGRADNYAWIPFGGGVRRCIGAAFAEYEMRVVMRTILERASLSAPDPKPERVRVRNITLAPGKGTVVRLDRTLS